MKTATFKFLAVCLAVVIPSSAPAKPPTPKAKTQTHCHVHREALKHEWVKIMYGVGPSPSGLEPDFAEAMPKLFPFSNRYWLGGSIMTEHSPKFKKVDYCQQCRSAVWLWKRSSPGRTEWSY